MTTAFARDVCWHLKSEQNMRMIHALLQERFGPIPCLDNLPAMMGHFCETVSHELSMSDPLPGAGKAILQAYNKQFVGEAMEFIAMECGIGQQALSYTVTDGRPTARSDYRRSANCLLSDWIDAPSSAMSKTLREDPQSDGGSTSGVSSTPIIHYNTSMYQNPPKCDKGPTAWQLPRENSPVARMEHFTTSNVPSGYPVQLPRRPDFYAGVHPDIAARGLMHKDPCHMPTTGIDFTDVRHENPFAATYQNAYTRAWNDPETNIPVFGDGSVATDASLQSRRIFRTESGVESGIPFYRRTVQHRHFDRDVTEGLRGDSRGFMIQSHDMKSLYDRVDQKMRNRASSLQQPCTQGDLAAHGQLKVSQLSAIDWD